MSVGSTHREPERAAGVLAEAFSHATAERRRIRCRCTSGRDWFGAALRRPLLRILGIPTMRLTTLVHQATPFVAVGAGILVLIRPQLLNFVVAACLILIGVVG